MIRQSGIVLCAFLIGVAGSHAAPNDHALSISVLSARTESIPVDSSANGVPVDCGLSDFSAYCHQSRAVKVRNTMLVRDSAGKSFTISCLVDSRWSRCAALPSGESFAAEKEQRGLAVWYRNAKGREVKASYAMVPLAPADLAAVPVPQTVTVPTDSSATKCRLASTPSGAEITVDGKYVGNTPSSIALGFGTHFIVIAIPGFVEWKREIEVSTGSDVTVAATLQKAQP
jgi:hypothetical protein